MIASNLLRRHMKTINDFDLSSKHGRHKARKAGFDVPKQKPGIKQEDFWFWVNVKNENECWPWLKPLNKWGYGRYKHNNFYAMAHRIAYELTTGKNIDGKVAMHICDNPACCNPKHLAIGTHADNQADKVAKNRQAKGEKNGSSVLTANQVLEARKKYKETKIGYVALAKEYGVSRDTIQKAVRGIYWKHL
jgi:hypothetical protein